MPVFARTKLVIQEDCYREKPERFTLKYSGKSPLKFYEKTYEILKNVFRASDSDIEEEQYNWSVGPVQRFKVRWYLHKDIDPYSYFYIRVDVSGEGDEKNGKITIRVKPVMRTEYPQDTFWQRSLLYEILRTFWHRVFYARKMEEYLEECRNLCTLFQRELDRAFKGLKEE